MNTGKIYFSLMKLNVLSSNYVDDSYKIAWENNIYPFFHDSRYEYHQELSKYFDRAEEKTLDKLCLYLDNYLDDRVDFSKFEEGVEKILGKGNVFPVLHYFFQAGQYPDLLSNLRMNLSNLSTHFVNRFETKGYWK
ncbi:hypothetical protein ACFPDQ_04815 [Pseudofrancisella aestuarii]|uniref:CdiI immunity protein domain-containing protein n=1 Tax=Pseudofrancisella aestuarii TaxID=2670347 RepID=A0ABV9TC42_9GAMM|nr:hypothetical protein [Pseudofrancisella aestuarii]